MRCDVESEVEKATDYTGSKLIGEDNEARDRIMTTEDDLKTLGRMWTETVAAAEESLKEMITSSNDDSNGWLADLEVSVAFDKGLAPSVEKMLRGFFIASMIGMWFKFANKNEAAGYFSQAAEMMLAAERLLYSRKRPAVPSK